MIEVVTEEMDGSDRVPDLKRLRASLGWRSKSNSKGKSNSKSKGSNESEMARSYESTDQCALNVLDSADIVRDGDFATTEVCR
jgi:hypothetical protein